MNFYEYIHILSYLFMFLHYLDCSSNDNLRTVKTGIGNVLPCSVGMRFFAIVNNTSELDDFNVEFIPDQCCVDLGASIDCDVLDIVGECLETVPKGSTKIFNLVAPTLDPYNRRGYCIAFLDSKTVQHKRSMRNVVNIPFDTRSLPAGARYCKTIDEDPLNDCQPVDCEVFYNGKKSFYNVNKKQCVAVPPCISVNGEMPDTVYDPVSNQCFQDDSICKDDLEFIKGLAHRNNERIVKDIVIIKKLTDDQSKSTVYADLPDQELIPNVKIKIKLKPKNKCIAGLLDYFYKNKYGVLFLSLIISMQCCVMCMMLCFSKRRCWCKKKDNKIEQTFMNYRQDASITTPLLGMTNIDTETTCQFMSESSHVDKKIQSYKACQKENAKISMSDDILSKCVNRRNWDRKQARSDSVEQTCETKVDNSKTYNTLYISATKNDQNFDSEKDKNQNKSKKNVVKIEKSASKTTASKEKSGTDVFASERELKCLNYEGGSKTKVFTRDFNAASSSYEKELQCHSYNYGMKFYDNDNESNSGNKNDPQNAQVYSTNVAKPSTNYGQMSAQASFSNDSIDDYLSERGMLFLTGENISKYSFSDSSIKSSITSKTSKKNIMKHVLSYLKREKHGPSSEPGKKKDQEINLELLHMSKATMYSSSNNENECLKTITRPKDSRTSL